MIMKKQKRYESEQEILDAIIAAQLKATQYEKDACQIDLLKDDAIKLSNREGATPGDLQYWREQVDFLREKAERLRQRSNRIKDMKMIELKNKLSEFQTEPMPFLGLDRSVAA
jgi:hypothetical protein